MPKKTLLIATLALASAFAASAPQYWYAEVIIAGEVSYRGPMLGGYSEAAAYCAGFGYLLNEGVSCFPVTIGPNQN